MGNRTRYVIAATIIACVAMPCAAQAASKTVFMGAPPASQKDLMKTGSDVNAFFPTNISINTGGTVAFVPVGFHSVDLPAGGQPVPLFAPTGKKAAASDAAGIPFWFNQADVLGFDQRLLASNFGKTKVKGASRITSGLPLGPKLKPLKVRFNKAGSFTYFCNVHPGQRGTVRVRSKSTPVPSAKADAARVSKQVADALKVATALPKNTKPAANTVSLGADGKGGVHFFGMLPQKLTVPRGTTVTFAMPRRSTDVHTASFGPGDADKKTTYMGAITASFESPAIDPRGMYPSEKPGTPPVALSPALHGNGFWSTGALDGVDASPLPASGKVTFNTAGSYNYVCFIHSFMKGTVTVQ